MMMLGITYSNYLRPAKHIMGQIPSVLAPFRITGSMKPDQWYLNRNTRPADDQAVPQGDRGRASSAFPQPIRSRQNTEVLQTFPIAVELA
jgi:hypothetical protein